MGDPKKLRKKYKTPIHPWKAESIEAEKGLKKEYGLVNKKEIWKMGSILKKYKDLAKKVIAVKTEQGEKEKRQMIEKLQKLGLIAEGAKLDDVLSLEVKDIIERRLQSLVFRLGLARSMKQARQFIVHRHIIVKDKKITFPSYIVSREEEGQIRFDEGSSLSKEDHPERINLEEEKEERKARGKEGKEVGEGRSGERKTGEEKSPAASQKEKKPKKKEKKGEGKARGKEGKGERKEKEEKTTKGKKE